jgi:transposase
MHNRTASRSFKAEAQGGRARVSDRACLTGIVFVLRSGIPWWMLPKPLGCSSGMTGWQVFTTLDFTAHV